MRHIVAILAIALAALRGGGTGQTTPRPTNPVPVPDAPVTSWQPPFPVLR